MDDASTNTRPLHNGEIGQTVSPCPVDPLGAEGAGAAGTLGISQYV